MSHTHHHHHHKNHKAAQHCAVASHDPTGWVEGITALNDDNAATSLLSGATTTSPVVQSTTAAVFPRADVAAAIPGASVAPGTSASSSFEAELDESLTEVMAEVKLMGEVMLEVGAPNGWGPSGLTPEQLDAVLQDLQKAASSIQATATVLHTRSLSAAATCSDVAASNKSAPCTVADVLVRRAAKAGPPIEVRVAVIGNVDSGKSTLVGVLTRSVLDDGRGLARAKVFKHHHEESSGRTSSVGQHNLCLDASGNVLNDPLFRCNTCADYIGRAAKVITLVDLAGHEKYFRTTAYGLTGHLPDYACLIVGANMGVVGMCKEHLGVALALRVPIFFLVTKVDICPEHVLKGTLQALVSILKKPGVRKKPFLVRSAADALLCARSMSADALAPIFITSAVTGAGLDLVRQFYSLLPQRTRWAERRSMAAEFVIDETFAVPGVGTVVAGTVKSGVISTASRLLLGPDVGDAGFKPVAVKSLHYKRLPVQVVMAGQTAAIALKKIKRNQVRKGMALVDEALAPVASWEFAADIAVLTHSTTIGPRYQAVIHCEIIRQAAKVVAMDCDSLRSGDRASVVFRFLQRPEYVVPGTRFVFREGRTKGIGVVVSRGGVNSSAYANGSSLVPSVAAALRADHSTS